LIFGYLSFQTIYMAHSDFGSFLS